MNKNGFREYVDLTGDGGVTKKIELEGFGSLCPTDAEATCIYEGHLEDGRIIDNTRIRQEPYSFVLGKEAVIKGLEIAVKSMKIGEKARVKIRSDYGYGTKELENNKPPKPISEMEESEAKKYSDLEYEIELVKHDKVRKSKTQMDFDERIAEAADLKENGNQLFREKRYREAMIRYDDGLKYLTQIPTQALTQKIIDLRSTLALNVTNCHIQLHEYHYALKKVNEAMEIKPVAKCYYFRCISYIHLAEFEQATKDLKQLGIMLPGDKQVENLEKELVQQKEKYTKEKNNLFKKGLFKSGLYDDVKVKERGPYPDIDVKNLFIYFDIKIGLKPSIFRDAKKIKIELYRSLHKEICENIFDLLTNNSNLFQQALTIREYDHKLVGLCIFENLEISLDPSKTSNKLPLIDPGLLILRPSTKEVFISINGTKKETSQNDYVVIGKTIYNNEFLSQIFKEYSSVENNEDNTFTFEIPDHGKALTI